MTETEKREQLIMDFKSTFGSPEGQRVLAHLTRYCLVDGDIFVEESARKTDFNLGANNVYRHIMKLVNSNPKEELQTEVKE